MTKYYAVVELIIEYDTIYVIIGEDGIFFRGGAGPQFSPRRGHDFST